MIIDYVIVNVKFCKMVGWTQERRIISARLACVNMRSASCLLVCWPKIDIESVLKC
jgi:hypothetical protein